MDVFGLANSAPQHGVESAPVSVVQVSRGKQVGLRRVYTARFLETVPFVTILVESIRCFCEPCLVFPQLEDLLRPKKLGCVLFRVSDGRSEERRVGKECRSR